MPLRRLVWELEVGLEDVDRAELVCQDADVVDDVVSGRVRRGCAVLCLEISL